MQWIQSFFLLVDPIFLICVRVLRDLIIMIIVTSDEEVMFCYLPSRRFLKRYGVISAKSLREGEPQPNKNMTILVVIWSPFRATRASFSFHVRQTS